MYGTGTLQILDKFLYQNIITKDRVTYRVDIVYLFVLLLKNTPMRYVAGSTTWSTRSVFPTLRLRSIPSPILLRPCQQVFLGSFSIVVVPNVVSQTIPGQDGVQV